LVPTGFPWFRAAAFSVLDSNWLGSVLGSAWFRLGRKVVEHRLFGPGGLERSLLGVSLNLEWTDLCSVAAGASPWDTTKDKFS